MRQYFPRVVEKVSSSVESVKQKSVCTCKVRDPAHRRAVRDDGYIVHEQFEIQAASDLLIRAVPYQRTIYAQ